VRVIIQDEDSTTATSPFIADQTSTSSIKTLWSQNSLIIDDDHQIPLRLMIKIIKAISGIFFSFSICKTICGELQLQLQKISKKSFHLPNDSALKTLIESFNHCIATMPPSTVIWRSF
jgi:hypothetical protein